MAGYDPKAKRAHSPATADGPAPVDDLLGAPTPKSTTPEVTAPVPPERVAPAAPSVTPAGATMTRPSVTPPAATGPDPRVLAVAAGVAVLAFVLWRRRR